MARNILSIGGERQINLLDAANSSNGLAGSQLAPEITALPNGNFVAVYQNPWYAAQSDIDLMWQEFRSDGTRLTGPNRLEFAVGAQLNPDVAPRANNGFVTVWEDSGSIKLALVDPGNYSEPPRRSPCFCLAAPREPIRGSRRSTTARISSHSTESVCRRTATTKSISTS